MRRVLELSYSQLTTEPYSRGPDPKKHHTSHRQPTETGQWNEAMSQRLIKVLEISKRKYIENEITLVFHFVKVKKSRLC